MWIEELILIKKPNTQAGSECEYNHHTLRLRLLASQ